MPFETLAAQGRVLRSQLADQARAYRTDLNTQARTRAGQLAHYLQEAFTSEGTPMVVFGAYDAIWPTQGETGFGWHCAWCGLNAPDAVDLGQARTQAHHHADTHPEVEMGVRQVALTDSH